MPSGRDYATGQRLLMEEVNSLCRGAEIAGAKSLTVNDAHANMRTIIPDQLNARVRLISGHFKPMYMMEGLDASFDAAVFLGYHGPAGSASVLSHTYSPRVIWEARIDGEVTGETGINALVAHHYRVPVVLITGDEETVQDGRRWVPEATGIAVKRSIGRFAAESMSPIEAQTAIFDAIQKALENKPNLPERPEATISLELTFQTVEMAELAEWSGVTRAGPRTVRIQADDGLDAYRRFHTVLILARSVAEA